MARRTPKNPATRKAAARGRIQPARRRAARRQNPKATTFESAARMFGRFTDEEALHVDAYPLELEDRTYTWLLGRVVEVAYEIPRFEGERGVVAVHKFRVRSRPVLAATPRQLFIVGGRYEVTDHGIEDR